MNFCDIKRNDKDIRMEDCTYPHAFVGGVPYCGHGSPIRQYYCTRPKGHEGPHCGCGFSEHVYAEWANFSDRKENEE